MIMLLLTTMILYLFIKILNNMNLFHTFTSHIGLCKARASKYKDALSYFDICERYSIMYKDTKTQQLVLYDIALCYKKINKFDLALKNIEKYLLSSNKEDNFYFYANILKANCYEAIIILNL